MAINLDFYTQWKYYSKKVKQIFSNKKCKNSLTVGKPVIKIHTKGNYSERSKIIPDRNTEMEKEV